MIIGEFSSDSKHRSPLMVMIFPHKDKQVWFYKKKDSLIWEKERERQFKCYQQREKGKASQADSIALCRIYDVGMMSRPWDHDLTEIKRPMLNPLATQAPWFCQKFYKYLSDFKINNRIWQEKHKNRKGTFSQVIKVGTSTKRETMKRPFSLNNKIKSRKILSFN